MTQPGKLPFKPRLSAAARRALLEREAARLFAARGYEETSVEDIARAAGVTKRVLYDHFPSKRELHIALLRGHTERLLVSVGERFTAARTPLEQLADGIDGFFLFVEENPFAWRMLFRDPPSDPVVAEAHREVQRAATAAIAGWLAADPDRRARVPAGRPDWLEMIAEQFKAGINGLAGWWYEHRDVPRDEVVAAARDLFWHGLDGLGKREG